MKLVKQGSRVNATLALPKDLNFKVLGSLITELWDKPFGEGQLTVDDAERANKIVKDLKHAVRHRSVTLLLDVTPHFQPRRILEVTGANRENAQAFYALYQVGSFLKKYPFKGEDTATPAIQKFLEADRSCELFNNENYKSLLSLNESHPAFAGVLDEIRDDIFNLLGENPQISGIIDHATHGPGVSLDKSYRNGKTTEYYKWSTLPYSLTEGVTTLAKTAISADPQWIGALDNWYRETRMVPVGQPIDMCHFWHTVLKVVDGSRTTTVPKSSVIDRTIAIEPLLNVFFQLGVDRVLRRKLLRKWGLDLNSQERNQVMAKEGSISDELVTVDLSMASDLISLKICEMFLPPAWFDLLLDLRCNSTSIDGSSVPLEKISSMGNGFTFALETLIFAALTRVAVRRTQSERKIAVFGDDIILPRTAYSYLKDLLSLSGFKLNTDKTYSEGPFRESCGKDYFLGYDVRPIFLKRVPTGLQDLFYLHNSLYSIIEKLPWHWGVSLDDTLDMIQRWIPTKFRKQFVGPMSESLDTHLFSRKNLRRNGHGQKFYWQVTNKPMNFNRNTDFFFRKLMCRPHPSKGTNGKFKIPIKQRINALFDLDEAPILDWDIRKKLSTGNAFDVTKRGKVLLRSAKVCLP